MITVTIFINGVPIIARSARNIYESEDNDTTPSKYLVDTGAELTHFRTDGAVALAIKMLETVVEP